MSYSYSQPVQVNCTYCGRDFEADAWFIVDVNERPDLLKAAQDGTLYMPACPYCKHRDAILINSLLLYFPDEPYPLVFIPEPGLPDEQLKPQISGFGGFLRDMMGAAWQDNWMSKGIPVVSRNKLLEYLQPDFGDKTETAATMPPMPTALQPHLYQAVRLSAQHEETGKQEDLELAIDAWDRLVGDPAFATLDQELRAGILLMCATLLRERYIINHQPEDLERALQLCEQGLASGGIAERPGLLNLLGLLLRHRHRESGNLDFLRRAIASLEEAVAETSREAPNMVSFLSNLGLAVWDLYKSTSTAENLDRAISVYRQAVELADPLSPASQRARNSLGDALIERYNLEGESRNLDEAIHVFNEAIESGPEGKDLAESYNGRGSAFLDRFSYGGDEEDLNSALQDLEQAIRVTSDWPDMTRGLVDLGNAQRSLYDLKGDPVNLERARESYRKAFAQVNKDKLNPYVTLYSLGVTELASYIRTGSLSDLDQAIGTLEEAVRLTDPNSLNLPRHLGALASGLMSRFQHNGNIADLDRALGYLEAAAQAAPPHSAARPSVLESLGSALTRRYRHSRDEEDLNRAIIALEEATKLAPAKTLAATSILNSFGTALMDRYGLKKEAADLERAIEAFEQGLAATLPRTHFRYGISGSLAHALEISWERNADSRLRDRAIELYRSVLDGGVEIVPGYALQNAANWCQWAFRRREWSEVAEAYSYVRAATESLLRIQIVRPAKESWLRESQGLAAQACYALAKIGDLNGAILALEQGAAVLLSEAVDRDRADLEKLRDTGHSQVLEQYRQAAQHWYELSQPKPSPDANLSDRIIMPELHDARARLDNAVDAVRKLPGYERFLMAATFEEVQRVANESQIIGSLVYLATTEAGSVALIMTENGPEVVWSDFNEQELLSILVKSDEGQIVGGYLPGQILSRELLEDSLAEVLPILGDRLLGPVVKTLRSREAQVVTLIPIGRLALLPLAAAKYPYEKTTKYLLDEFTVQFAPNSHSMQISLDELNKREGESRLVAVGNPLPAERPLPGAELEVHAIGRSFEADAQLILLGRDATLASLKENLSQATYLHFACHGVSRPHQALLSALMLSEDQELTLYDLLYGSARVDKARLVVLSACQSAIPDFTQLPDELVGLPAGFMQMGVPGVVGTLWSIDDLSTPVLMKKFYEFHLAGDTAMSAGPLRPSVALLKAQRWLRGATASSLADFFDNERTKPDSERGVAYEVVSTAWRRFAALPPDTTPYGPPVFWAAFTFYGL